MRLAETIAAWFGRVEIVLAGVEGQLRDGEEALVRGDAMRARRHAKAILARVPHSPVGLALLADACEAGHLDAELALTLEELAGRVPSRGEIWVRLGRARERVNCPIDETSDAFLRALAVAEAGSEARREALLWLADLDLSRGDGARAELWLERLANRTHPEVAGRRAEARLLQNDIDGAREALDGIELDPADGRAALLRGRILALANDEASFPLLLRAMVLDVPNASETLASALATIPTDNAMRAKIRTVVHARGEVDRARWRAAFARAEGRRDEARAALVLAVRAGDMSAARPLFDTSIEDQDFASLAVALSVLGHTDADVRDARKLPSPARLRDPGEAAAILDDLGSIGTARVKPWADSVRRQAIEAWIPPSGTPSRWTELLTRLDSHARGLHAIAAIAKIAELAVERSRPVRLAVVGEFNAGKSTFINAVMGADVAPTGVLPTTATLHHLRYAPDPFARIQFFLEPEAETHTATRTRERIVPSSELRAALKTIDVTTVERVEILMPIASLTRVEILDTPGFNAPCPKHNEAARSAFEQADALVWLLDAAQPLKQSERLILEEAKAQKLPVQILVNKADRLDRAELSHVMHSVAASLDAVGLRSWSPPIALSARLALKGKLGDAASLEQSGWAAVQVLLDEQIIGRSSELKERGQRRRAARVTGELEARARELADRERTSAIISKRRAHDLAARAGELERQADDTAQEIAGALTAAATEWKSDLDVVVTGRDRQQAESDPVLMRYQVERAVTRMAGPLAHVLASVARQGSTENLVASAASESDLLPLSRVLVRTFAGAGGRPEAIVRLGSSAVASLSEHLLDKAALPPPAGIAAMRVAELSATKEALNDEMVDRVDENAAAQHAS
ncbi:MAG: dynamin family protein [Polyangiaceae bacterium]|nr:dynamin family protein [Polyangiaceae bacterium]